MYTKRCVNSRQIAIIGQNMSNFAFSELKSTLAWKKHTSAGSRGSDLYELWSWFCMSQICCHILEDQSCFKSYAILKYFELFFSCICFRDLVTSRKTNPVLKVSDPTLPVSLEKLLGAKANSFFLTTILWKILKQWNYKSPKVSKSV